MTGDRPASGRGIPILIWAAAALLLIILSWPSIATRAFRDADDMMRLIQVRDLIAGQNWFDVSQHRVNPPVGGPMHWSRIVDLPIAAIIITLSPLIGAAQAETVAVVAVPLVLLLGTVLAVHAAALRLGCGRWSAVVAGALPLTMLSIVIQFSPLRIDHHGWQIMLAAIMMHQTARGESRAAGLLCGLAGALWFHISVEGLPYVVAFGGVYAMRYILDAGAWRGLRDYALALLAGSVMLLLGTRGWPEAMVPHCDAASPVYLVPLAGAVIALLTVHVVSRDDHLLHRIRPLVAAAVIGASLYWEQSVACRSGPFAALPPIVHEMWYVNVLEGMPFWHQSAEIWPLIIGPSIIGLATTIMAMRASSGTARHRWAELGAVLVVAVLVSIMVARAMSVAHLLAAPGIAWFVAQFVSRQPALAGNRFRVAMLGGVALLLPYGAAQVNGTFSKGKDEQQTACPAPAALAALGALPAATVFAPLDIGPDILLTSAHRVVGTAHHRNVDGMERVIRAFLAAPAAARPIVVRSGATYLALCPDQNEAGVYQHRAPDGLAAVLAKGQTPDWLEPLPGYTGGMRVYRVR